ncbi:uncharacterized protein B0T23DRAFT_398498 [Neurospora hispaniola]|uniref:Uncharacterized protein n=1 Tax=Neurospora hispaniola TaxID=588809 RepID=A0AAJ0I1W1_9PEZI|nr:hypothetical protein B0T23DRAFT_398498 [Neurospora hispaniola]
MNDILLVYTTPDSLRKPPAIENLIVRYRSAWWPDKGMLQNLHRMKMICQMSGTERRLLDKIKFPLPNHTSDLLWHVKAQTITTPHIDCGLACPNLPHGHRGRSIIFVIAKPIGFGAAHDIEKIRRWGLKFGYGMTKTKARHDSSARHDTNTTWEEKKKKKKKKRRTKLPSRIKPWPGLSQKISSPAAAIIRRVLHRLVIVEDVISITIESVSEEQKAGVGV